MPKLPPEFQLEEDVRILPEPAPVVEVVAAQVPATKSKKTTSKNAWKQFERDVASTFSCKRVPLSGSNSGHGTSSDSLHGELYIECKYRQRFELWTLFEDTEKKARAEGKLPVVAIKQKGAKGFLLLVRPEDLEKVTSIKNKTQGPVALQVNGSTHDTPGGES